MLMGWKDGKCRRTKPYRGISRRAERIPSSRLSRLRKLGLARFDRSLAQVVCNAIGNGGGELLAPGWLGNFARLDGIVDEATLHEHSSASRLPEHRVARLLHPAIRHAERADDRALD